MKKIQPLILLIFIFFIGCSSTISPDKSLMISSDSKYLTYPDGKPFLWIGDTAWELFHRLTREEALDYLENRAKKGISIIQAVVLAENDGLRTPNAYGDLPLIDLDPMKPNEEYFKHVDFIVNKAEELGLFIGMLPTWGDKIYSEHPGAGPIVFNEKNARFFGEFLGKRYKDKPIVWILGGDRNIANREVFAIWKSMAEGLETGDGGRNLISYHPRGASISSHFLHNEAWLDFNMYQSGHSKHFTEVYAYANHLALLQPRKPYIDGEPPYEDIAVEFWNYIDFSKSSSSRVPENVIDKDGIIIDKSHFQKGFFNDADVRVHGYWNFLSGACGYTYGNNAIWQMWRKGMDFAIPCLMDWRSAMDRPGSEDLKWMRKILEARPFNKLLPDLSIIYGPVPDGRKHIAAAIADDKSFMLVYLSVGQEVTINMNKLDHQIAAWWYDTRTGSAKRIGDFENKGIHEFIPPSSGNGNDWLLVLDDSSIEQISIN